MDFIKSLLSDFDVSSLLPKLDSLLSKVELLARIVVMAGPVILLVLGLWYLLLPPKEANYAVGYRFFWGMSSVESWRFTQLVAGIVWCVLGLLLSLVMYLLSGGFQDKPLMDIVWKCVEYVFWEMGLLAGSCLIINLTVVFTFNSKGIRRREKKIKDKTDAEIVEQEVKRFVHDVNEKLHQKPSLDKVKAAGAALLHKPPAQQVQAMPALEQPAEAVDAAEPVAVPMVEEIPAAQEAPVEEAAAQEAPVVLPVAAPVVEASAAEVPAPAEETSAAQEIPAAQETEPVEEKPSVLDKIKAFFASLADKIKGLFASLKSKKKDEEPAAEETPEAPAEEIPAEEAVEAPSEEAAEETVENTAQEEAVEETQSEPAEETPQLPLIVPPSQQHKNPYGTKKRYPKGTKKKGKK